MKKKLLCVIISAVFIASVTGCNKKQTESDVVSETTEASIETTIEETETSDVAETDTTIEETETTEETTEETTTTTTEKKTYPAYNKRNDVLYQGSFGREGHLCLNPKVSPYYNDKDARKVNFGDPFIAIDFTYDNCGGVWLKTTKNDWVLDAEGWSRYFNLIDYMKYEYDMNRDNCYFTYDVDHDGSLEWFLQEGDARSNSFYYVFSPTADFPYCAGTIVHGILYETDDGELVLQDCYSGGETLYRITYKNGIIDAKMIYDRTVDSYSTPGTEIKGYTYDYFFDGRIPRIAGDYPPFHDFELEEETEYFDDSYYDDYDDNYDDYEDDYSDYTEEPEDDDWTDWETPNVWCPECGYGMFITGIGDEGIDCPDCGANYFPE